MAEYWGSKSGAIIGSLWGYDDGHDCLRMIAHSAQSFLGDLVMHNPLLASACDRAWHSG